MKEKKSQRKLNLYFSKFVICHHQSGTLMYLKNYQKNGKKCIQNSLNQLKLVFKACVSGLSISYPKIIHMLNIFSLAFFSSVSIFTFAFFYDNFFFCSQVYVTVKSKGGSPVGLYGSRLCYTPALNMLWMLDAMPQGSGTLCLNFG